MSVLIKGMEMPKSCFYCPFRRKINPDDIQCLVTRDVFEETFAGTIESRNRGNCPLIELLPHGRLIDADALRQSMYHEAFETDSPMQKWDSGCWIRYKMFERLEGNAPTVIEAEVSE